MYQAHECRNFIHPSCQNFFFPSIHVRLVLILVSNCESKKKPNFLCLSKLCANSRRRKQTAGVRQKTQVGIFGLLANIETSGDEQIAN